jgi:hypothetical protein
MGGMVPIAHVELVSTYYDPSWPFEMYPSVEAWSGGPQLPADTVQPDWGRVALVHNDRGSRRLCAGLIADPDSTAGCIGSKGRCHPRPIFGRRWISRYSCRFVARVAIANWLELPSAHCGRR